MLNFIIGTKGSGKTAEGHRILGECVKNGGEAMLIVPKQFTFESDKGILSLLSPKLACQIEVLSFSRLCHIALQSYGGIENTIASGGVRSILMSLAVEAVGEQLTVFARHKNEIALTQKMLSFVDEMKNEGITAEDLEICAEKVSDRFLSQKLREVALISNSYDSVVSQSFFDDGDLLRAVAEILQNTDFFKDKTIVIDGFPSFSFGEYKLIEQMLKKAKNVYVTLCTDSLNIGSDLSPFAVTGKTARKLRLLAGTNSVESGSVIKTERGDKYPEDLSAIEKNIFLPDYKTQSESENVEIICCGNILSECDTVGRKIKALIRTGKYRCRDIAVIYRNSESYERPIKNALKKYGVPLFEDRRQPVSNQPLICFVRNVLSICSEGFSADYVFRLCKTGLWGVTTDEISLLENYVFMWDIGGKKWLSSWAENPDGFGCEMNEERKAVLCEINSLRERIVEPLAKLKEEIEFCEGKKAVEKLYNFIRDNKVDEALKSYALTLEKQGMHELALEQEQVWDILMEVFDEIAVSLCENGVNAKRLLELFEIVISTKSLGKLPDGFDEVSLLSAERALTKKAEIVFVVGLNSGVFPAVQVENGVFSASEKAKIILGGIEELGDAGSLTLRERFLCYNALSAPSQKLILTYPLSDSAGEKLTQSECIEWVKKILPSVKEDFSSDCDLIDLVESEKSAFEIMAKNWKEKGKEINALKKYFSEKDEYKGRLDAISLAVSERNFKFENGENAVELFGKNLYFSASQLETYGQCPFMYFCRYGLKAKPRQKAKLDPAQSGTVVHFVLEKLLSKYKGKEFLSLTKEQTDEEIKALLNEYMNTEMGGTQEKGERFKYLYSRMEKNLRNIFDRLACEFADSDFEACDFEMKISRDGDVKPFKIDLDEGSAEFFGVIDRVDKMDLDNKRYVRVVDYKTGVKQFRLSDVIAGLNMQMMLYLVSIWRKGKGEYENIIPSGVLYFPARMVPNNAQRGDDENIRTESRHSLGRMSGMLLDDENIIRHMDKNCRGIFIPAKYDVKKDCFKGDFISLAQLEKLAQRMDEIIRKMGNNLHKGNIPAEPVTGKGHGDTCLWCDFGDVCMNEGEKYRYVENLSHAEAINLIMGGEDNGEKLDE